MEQTIMMKAVAMTLHSDLWGRHGETRRAAYHLTEAEGPSQMLLSPLPPHLGQA